MIDRDMRPPSNASERLPAGGEAGDIPSAWGSAAATLLLMVGPPIALLYLTAGAARYLALGAASWVLAVTIKLLVMRIPGVPAVVASGSFGAAVWGLFSAGCELGLCALLLVFGGYDVDLSMANILAVGVGVASAEILYVFAAAIREHLRGRDEEALKQWIVGARQSLWVRNMLFIERLSATLGHIGTRGLVLLAIDSATIWPAAIALMSFAVVDGIAIFGRGRNWNWCDPKIARAFYSMTLLMAVLELSLFLILAVQ
jgi:hypothetical protein